MADTVTASSAELPVKDDVVSGVDAVAVVSGDAPAQTVDEPATEEAAPKPVPEGKWRGPYLLQHVN